MSLNIEVLEQSFERVKPHATNFASSFYNNLFTDYPELQSLFALTNMEAQEKKFTMLLVLVSENLRNPNYWTTILKNLGERHVSYGAMREHYPMVGAALLKTFESYLGADWTPEVKQAWTDAYGAIVNLMLERAKYPETVLKSENALQHSAKPAAIRFAPTQAPATVSSLNYSKENSKVENVWKSLNIEVLEHSFERVKPHATNFASSFYNNLFTDYPELQSLFALTNMEAQEKKFTMLLVLVSENLRNPNYWTTILKNLGERHVSYGAMREHYPMVGAALLKTFESYLGADWTPEVKQAWTDAYGAIINLMLEGAKYPETITYSS